MDRAAQIAAQWRTQRPDLDPGPLLVLGRVQHVAALLDIVLRPPFAAAGLGNGDFDVLAALRREGPPFELSPGQLSERMLVTSGAVTKRVDRLVARGFVERNVSETDARGRVVRLTPAGRDLCDRLIAEHLANEAAVLDRLTPRDRRTLERLLTALVEALEERAEPGRPARWLPERTPRTDMGLP